jgi:hypothetical protein
MRGNSARSNFTAGGNYRVWLEWFRLLNIPYDEENPVVWMTEVFDSGTRPKKKKIVRPKPKPAVLTKAESEVYEKAKNKATYEHKKKLKEVSVVRAKRLYPDIGSQIIRHDRAEAVLIMHYCWLKYKGKGD